MKRLRDERGASAVEYALMVSLIAAAVMLALVLLGTSSSSTFRCTGNNIRAIKCEPGCEPSVGQPARCRL